MAAQYLQDAGYIVLERNRRSQGGEIDIVARDTSGAIVFVEVRTRRGPGADVSALESVDAAKQQRLLSGATAYLADHVDPNGADLPARIDVIAVAPNRRGALAVARHVRNAVEA